MSCRGYDRIILFWFSGSHILRTLVSFSDVMDSKIVCRCGRNAFVYTASLGFLCVQCLDKMEQSMKESEKNETVFLVKSN